ncbi:MAG: translocation/assembly module TamB domain-containing protein [Bacteroidetes bacterium]|nr:translocation/assembly module TamB domain-containing protein [Bacteroidota bacterium]
MLKRLLKIFRNFLLIIMGLMVAVVVLINFTPVQNFIVKKATEALANKLQTKVNIAHVRIDFLNHILLQGLYLQDHHGDTLLYAGEARVRITDWFFLQKEKPILHYIGLHQALGHLYRTDSSKEWNYQFIIDAFDNGKKSNKPKQTNTFEIDLRKIDIQNARFHMDDAWVGSDYDIDLGNVQIQAENLDLKKQTVSFNKILVENAGVTLRDYVGGRPDSLKPKPITIIDTTSFNTDNWQLRAKTIQLNNCAFTLDATTREAFPKEFDPGHIDIQNINILASNIRITKDTIWGKVNNMSANERSGIKIKKFKADISVSPNASICKNLFLETNNSKLNGYYAMHYKRFPDFLDYIYKVKMVGKLHDSYVEASDIAFFAPALRQFHTTIRVAGEVEGTVDKLNAQDLNLTDGSSALKGNLKMTGLPDINQTFIQFENGMVYTTGIGILKYAPKLRNNPNIAIEKLTQIFYRGNFTGYIDHFAANGLLQTNLGSIQSNIKLFIPNRVANKATYSGVITTTGFQLGTLIRQPLLGSIALHANVQGVAFDPEIASVKVNGVVNHFDLNGYRYQNIDAEGSLARKKFDGKLLVDDPNLALSFNGSADFNNHELKINATANLLKSNLKALNFTKDSMTASSDFDLNFIGNSIDSFFGYAKLFNINLVRNIHRLDVDSIYIRSTTENGEKLLVLESNDLVAHVRGNYQLSTLPRSVQYYVSGYLPNYIKAPTKYAPNQALLFDVQTRHIDSLFAVLLPGVKGFSNASLNGSLNTFEQKLDLAATIPYGYLYGITLNGVTLNGTGNFNKLTVQAKSNELIVGNNAIKASIEANATVGNDSIQFQVATTSNDAVGTLAIKGHAHASGDTLYMHLLPSDFYLNQNRWEILPENHFAFSKDYLQIQNLKLKSGSQLITAHTENETTNQSLLVSLKNIDVAMLGNLAGIAIYQPNGSINGNLSLHHLFSGLELQSNLKATNVTLGADTLGTINLIGSYLSKKQIITLDAQSGIFHGDNSIRAAGSMSLDSNNTQLLNGYLQFNYAQIAWLSPILNGYVSKLEGYLNGNININGSATQPNISGEITIGNAALKIDMIGTHYRIPYALLKVDNNKIDFGRIMVLDDANRPAILTGGIAHDRFRNMTFNRVSLTSSEIEALNLKDYENNTFYGNLVAAVESMTISGPMDDIKMSITASPAQRSHIFIPIRTSSDIGSYSYVSFRALDTTAVLNQKRRNKFSLSIIGKMNPLAEMTLVLDPATGDMINAKGNGTITLNVPSDDDVKMYGNYEIDEGDYTFTLRQLAFRRNFIINSGSKISFNGPLSATNLNINALYTTRARMIDLLTDRETQFIKGTQEERDAKTAQNVVVKLYMTGSLNDPKLNFNIDLADTKPEGTLAYQKLKQINQNDRELFDQVASLLLIGTFIPPEGMANATTATTGAINNVSELISTNASAQLTNVVNKLLGDPNLSIELKYKNYNLSDPLIAGGVNRNEVSFGIRKNLFKDRLILELGSTYDWGRPTSSNSTTSNLNPAGDFRLQYLLTKDGRVRLNAFRTSSYDVLVDRNIWRGGIGISYRKSFNNIWDLLNSSPPQKNEPKKQEIISDSVTQTKGTF